jgi:hypothetical protein
MTTTPDDQDWLRLADDVFTPPDEEPQDTYEQGVERGPYGRKTARIHP